MSHQLLEEKIFFLTIPLNVGFILTMKKIEGLCL